MDETILAIAKNELKHGGPHVHFLAFIFFNLLGILLFHFVFRFLIVILVKITHIKEKTWKSTFRFMPTLVGMLAGSRMAKDFLNVPWFIKELMENHFRSLLLITVTFFIAHLSSSLIKARMTRRESESSSMSILTTVIDLAIYMAGFLIILSSYGISISPLLTWGTGFGLSLAGHTEQFVFRYHHDRFPSGPYGGLYQPFQWRIGAGCRYELAQYDPSDVNRKYDHCP